MKQVICFLMMFFPFICRAELKIDVNGAGAEPVPVAIPAFLGDENNLSEIVISDLEKTGLFRVVNPDAYIQKFQSFEEKPTFADWQAINTQALLQAKAETNPDGQVKVSYKLWDIYAGKMLEGKAMTLPLKEARRLGHILADNVYSRITGEKGYFDTRIVYVAETGPLEKRTKRLAIMDFDGSNHHYLTDGQYMALTPRFSPNMQKVAYLSYVKSKPRVRILDLKTGQDKELGAFEGMTFSPRFSPDGKTLLLSMVKNGNADIYLYDLESEKFKRLTTHFAIDTTPCFSPDGKKIVFSSDRSGSQQLYVMNKDGSGVERISFSFDKGSYATPVWSPRGDYIAFTKIKKSEFYIGIMEPDGSNERVIATDFLVEGPTFAPNGRVLMYFKQAPTTRYGKNGKTGLYSIDVTGYHEQFIPTPQDASDPAWSPLLH